MEYRESIVTFVVILSIWMATSLSAVFGSSFPFEVDSACCIGICDDPDWHGQLDSCECDTACIALGDCCANYRALCMGGTNCPLECRNPLFPDTQCQCGASGEVGKHRSIDFPHADISLIDNDELKSFGKSLFELELDGSPGSQRVSDLLTQLWALYDPDVSHAEAATTTLETEFVDAVMSTPVMQAVDAFMRLHKPTQFNSMKLQEMWFGKYTRLTGSQILGSSGFEHVFKGEIHKKNNNVVGFHNWKFYDNQCGKTKITFMKDKSTYNTKAFGHNRGMQEFSSFKWKADMPGASPLQKRKAFSTMFTGTSPEFEMAVFTVCWFMRPDILCPMDLGSQTVNIVAKPTPCNRFVNTASPTFHDIDSSPTTIRDEASCADPQ